jgi:CRP-like cAMP-binding protein
MSPTRQAANHLLSGLPAEVQRNLVSRCELVRLSCGATVQKSGGPYHYLYFPTSCVISLIYTSFEGISVEVGLVGNEGVLGTTSFLGGGDSQHSAVVQVAGEALRVDARIVLDEFSRGGILQRVLLLYTHVLMTEISQTAVCNRLHGIEKRLCRWLLLRQDLVRSDQLIVTHELLSGMLGGRRESVAIAAGRLQKAGLIAYSRGRVRILDRTGLEHAACECYAAVKGALARLPAVAG